MRLLLQKVSQACVRVDQKIVGEIDQGYLLFLGVLGGDCQEQAQQLAEKVVKLRLFPGEDGKMNDRSLLDVDGDILVVSQFTLAGKFDKGNRPDYTQAMEPQAAQDLYTYFVEQLQTQGVRHVATGVFGAYMQVSLINDGPVTLQLER
ncbi:MAG: D-aminoacyl-tRNA deacylase [Candidatus Peribacteraceae bacterium]